MARRKSKADFPAALQEPTPLGTALDEVIERAGLTTADQLPVPERDDPAQRLGVSTATPPAIELELPPPEQQVVPSRPLGPRKRAPGEPRNVHSDVSRGFKVDEAWYRNVPYIEFVFSQEPENDWIRKLGQAGFYRKTGTTTWQRVANEQTWDSAQLLYNEFSGKAHVFDRPTEARGGGRTPF